MPASDEDAKSSEDSEDSPDSEDAPPSSDAKPALVLPKSATHFGLNSIALGVVLATFFYLRSRQTPLQN
jgi:hypothetical protein